MPQMRDFGTVVYAPTEILQRLTNVKCVMFEKGRQHGKLCLNVKRKLFTRLCEQRAPVASCICVSIINM